ncbi:flavin reductase family protein [Rhodopseudomonas sp. HC1]|uniref:flavin reductase family protein n=1 Tax=Rhodopseudomonas infernalis TaxID=2897386 RepID=UPI001EE812B0|nr:flavin reductase family protein [Rhodopseudomonas infernalis]MCG6204243.1 flavin reductase family protein [Rhodopseudomonas infernalis]
MSDPAAGAADEQRFDQIDLAALSRADRYKMLTGAVIPRPIAFVTSLGPGDIVNAAPFSQFVILAVDPGLLGFSVGPRTGSDAAKDTLANVQRTGEFVINMVPEGWEEIVQQASEEYPPDVSEVDLLGFTTLPSCHIRTPRLAGSKIQFECTLDQVLTFGDAPNHLVVGRIVDMHVAAGLTQNHKIDPRAYAPVARIGGRNYVRLGDIVGV